MQQTMKSTKFLTVSTLVKISILSAIGYILMFISVPLPMLFPEFLKIDIELNETESEIVALRKYYNDIITDYNKLAKSFPSNLVRIMCKYKKKPYFDGKNMDDDITNDFKL